MAERYTHVNQHHIRYNKDVPPDQRRPVFTVKEGKQTFYADRVEVMVGDNLIGTFVYEPDRPKKCGARVWFEPAKPNVTMRLTNPRTYADIHGEELPVCQIPTGKTDSRRRSVRR